MNIIVIGATGTIGKAVADQLAVQHHVIRVGHRGGDRQVDLADRASIERLFHATGRVDAVVCAAGEATFGPLGEMSEAKLRLGLVNKLGGQMELTRAALDAVNDRGSITLTAGLGSRFFVSGGATLAAVNAGLEAFTRAAALELPRGIRINVVSPGWVLETRLAFGMTPEPGIPASDVANAYVASVEGDRTGDVIDVGRAV